jgi:hypothetical protein
LLRHQSVHPEMIGSSSFGGSLIWEYSSTETVIDFLQPCYYHVRET